MADYVVPPIIQDWINKLRDKNTNLHLRDNVRMMLENVRNACDTEIRKFVAEKNLSSQESVQKKRTKKS
jgi:hypothetical protein